MELFTYPYLWDLLFVAVENKRQYYTNKVISTVTIELLEIRPV